MMKAAQYAAWVTCGGATAFLPDEIEVKTGPDEWERVTIHRDTWSTSLWLDLEFDDGSTTALETNRFRDGGDIVWRKVSE